MKFDLAQRIAAGRSKGFGGNKNPCKIVTIILGDNPNCYKDIELVRLLDIYLKTQSLALNIPIVILEGSTMANEVF